jgi:hypothetical protein
VRMWWLNKEKWWLTVVRMWWLNKENMVAHYSENVVFQGANVVAQRGGMFCLVDMNCSNSLVSIY